MNESRNVTMTTMVVEAVVDGMIYVTPFLLAASVTGFLMIEGLIMLLDGGL